MNETQVNGTQTDDVQVDETPDDDVMAGEMSSDGGEGDGWDVEKARRLRLRGFLRDLVRQEGKMEAAELLGVNHKTLTRAEDSGEMTGRLSDALELLLRRADDAEVARLRERVDEMEERLAALEDGVETPGSQAKGEGESGRDEHGDDDGTEAHALEDDSEKQVEDGQDGDGAGRSETRAAPQAVRLRPTNPDTLQPLDPEIVTVEPADDDVEVYGDAWPLVEEWRRLRVDHPSRGKGLLWLTTEERLLVLELAMLEERGLTLPPEKQPLRGFGRSGQTSWRRTALADARRALRRWKLLRWIAPWRWLEKALEPSQGPVSDGC